MAMTEPTSRRRRISKGALRTLAWIGGAVGFLFPWAALSLSPKPAATAGIQVLPGNQPREIVVRHVIRRIVVEEPGPASGAGVAYVTSGGSATAPVAAPPPPVTTGCSMPPP